MIIHMNGGGASLNFAVKAYPTEEALNAATPKENTIGVIVDYITGWTFGAEQPETTEAGAVWISTGNTSPVKFNALKKNALMVYPGSVMYYNGTEWKNVDAYIYQNGAWVKFSLAWDGYYFKDGNQYEYITGGWTSDGYKYYNSAMNPGTVDTTLSIKSNGSNTASMVGTANPVDLTNVDVIYINVDEKSGVGLFKIMETKELKAEDRSVDLSVGEQSVDVSDLTGSYYLAIASVYSATYGNASATVSAIYRNSVASGSDSGIALLSLDNTPGDDVVNAIVDDVGYGVTNATINEEPTKETYDFTVL